jgi:PAS domain S-box-containing protein
MLEFSTSFISAFDLFQSPFMIISVILNAENRIESFELKYKNSSFNNEFSSYHSTLQTDFIVNKIIEHININYHLEYKLKLNFVINFGNHNSNKLIYRGSCILSENNILSMTLDPIVKVYDPAWNSLLVNNAAIVYSTQTNGDYSFNYISDNVYDLLGYSAGIFVKANDFWDSLIEPSYKSYVLNSLHNLDISNEVRMVYPIKNSDGIYRWFEERAKLIRNQDGTPKEIIGMVIDVNEQKLSFDNMKKTLEELRTIINTIPGIIAVFDTKLRLLDSSESFLLLVPDSFKYSANGNIVSDLLPDFSEQLSKDLLFSMNNGKMFSRLTNASEEVFLKDSYKIIINPIIGGNSEIWGAVMVMFNITDFISKEKELKTFVQSLDNSRKEAIEQTMKIKSLFQELEKSEKNLLEINNQKDKFFSIIAHDLRTPLKGFMQLTKILSSEIDKLSLDEVMELTKTMYESSQNIYKLLDNLLEWSKIQRGNIEFNPITMQLSTLVMMNIDLMLPTARQKNIKLINEVNSKVLVYTDVNLINTVIRNLISNSMKFSYFDTEIRISAKLIEDGCVEICVKDFGIGMDEITLDKIFRLDCQVTSKGTNDESGTGLGLILCKELVKINGGKIRVESAPGTGSSFYFTVPAKKNN